MVPLPARTAVMVAPDTGTLSEFLTIPTIAPANCAGCTEGSAA